MACKAENIYYFALHRKFASSSTRLCAPQRKGPCLISVSLVPKLMSGKGDGIIG